MEIEAWGMGARGGPETSFRILKLPRGLHLCNSVFLSRLFAQSLATRQTSEASLSVPISKRQQLDLKAF